MTPETREVGPQGQVTLPKELRERLGIFGGDEVVIREVDGRIVIETSDGEARLAEGYRQRAERASELDAEMAEVSQEADEYLGTAPEW